MRYCYIALFGLLGVFARYGIGVLVSKFTNPPFPYATFFINIAGAFLIGIIYVLGVDREIIPNDLRIGIMVGFLGGFTTFSSYCLETFQLVNESQYVLAAVYLFFSPCVGFLATIGGVILTRQLLRSF